MYWNTHESNPARAKLYAWKPAANGEPAQWSSRGVGDLKLERAADGGGGGRPGPLARLG